MHTANISIEPWQLLSQKQIEDVSLLWSTDDITFFNTFVQNVMSNALGPAGPYAEVWLTPQ